MFFDRDDRRVTECDPKGVGLEKQMWNLVFRKPVKRDFVKNGTKVLISTNDMNLLHISKRIADERANLNND
jgi:hypothetical protein